MSDYDDHAYQRTIISELQKYLLDNFIESDTPPSKEMVCEDVFKSKCLVPQGALMFTLQRLQQWEQHEHDKMNEFVFVRRGQSEEELPFLGKERKDNDE